MMNHVDIMGRLTSAPTLRATASGNKVANIRVAVDRDYNRDETDYFDVVVWDRGAEFVCAYFDKGSLIGVSGRLVMREYTDREGYKRTTVEIKAERVYFAGPKPAERDTKKSALYGSSEPYDSSGPYDDSGDGSLPF